MILQPDLKRTRHTITATLAIFCALSCPAQDTPHQRAAALFQQTNRQFLDTLDRKQAREGFRHVLDIDPTFGPAWFNLGVLDEADHQLADALADFRHYLDVDPKGKDVPRARHELQILATPPAPTTVKASEYDLAIYRARVFLSTGMYLETLSEIGRARALDDTRWEAYSIAAVAMARQGKQQDAAALEAAAEARAPAARKAEIAQIFTQQSKPKSIPAKAAQ